MQYQVYRDALVWAAGKPVTIRMLDLGGDKQIAGIGASDRESFLGLRGVRLLLARPEIARVQIRALLRAAIHGDLKVLLPMVTFADEFAAMRQLFDEEAAHLSRRAVPHKMPSLGIMVEVPAAALMLDTFTDVDFFSLGTNDLAQYLTAAARDNPAVAGLYQQAGASVLRLIESTVLLCENIGKPISICGDMAGEVSSVAALLRVGLRQFSVAPSRLFEIRTHLARLNADGSQIRSGVNGA
jgi:phosphotransferase system enzyme I (PtsI)